MLYPQLFKFLEAVRWNIEKDVPWGLFDPALLTDEQAQTIRMNAITEWAALPATAMILHSLSNLFDQTFASTQELNRFRKSLAAPAAA